MHERKNEWLNEWMHEQTNKQTNEWMNKWYLRLGTVCLVHLAQLTPDWWRHPPDQTACILSKWAANMHWRSRSYTLWEVRDALDCCAADEPAITTSPRRLQSFCTAQHSACAKLQSASVQTVQSVRKLKRWWDQNWWGWLQQENWTDCLQSWISDWAVMHEAICRHWLVPQSLYKVTVSIHDQDTQQLVTCIWLANQQVWQKAMRRETKQCRTRSATRAELRSILWFRLRSELIVWTWSNYSVIRLCRL